MTLEKWNDIKEYFGDALLLGNGASVAIHGDFAYSNLWEDAVANGAISNKLQEISEDLETGPNFESLLRALFIAKTVNGKFKITDKSIDDAYAEVRDALKQTLRRIHCSRSDAVKYLENATPFLKNFDTIFSLNYDLLIYWAMMLYGNVDIFRDCFDDGHFAEDWEKYRVPYTNRGQRSRTLVFFPHGGLQFAQGIKGIGRKLSVSNQSVDLLTHIANSWEQESVYPLLITEGDSKKKMDSIQSNRYLSTVYNKILPICGETLVIYGWSIDESVDGHLLEQIRNGNYTRIAVAVHQPTTPHIEEFIVNSERKIRDGNAKVESVTFFDAEDDGCWIHKADDKGKDTP